MENKIKFWLGISTLSLSLTSVSCSQDDAVVGEDVSVEWGITQESEAQPFILPSGAKGAIPFKAEHLKSVHWAEVPQGWSVSVNATSDTVWVTAPQLGSGASSQCTLDMKLTGESGNEVSASFRYYWISSFDQPKGAFILNEGNMTTENGSLLYITPEGYMVDDVYKLVNGSELGNVCQDMAFHDGKIYIISQNGDKNPVGTEFENDGMLVVLDAKTLKKVDAYTKEELKELAWPSHIAVLDEEHVYIRDNGVEEGDNGSGQIWRLNTKDRSLTLLSGGKGAPKRRFVKKDDKLYTFKNGALIELLEISKGSDVVKSSIMSFAALEVYGLTAAPDGQIWAVSKYAGSGEGGEGFAYYADRLDERNKLQPQVKLSAYPNVGASGASMAVYDNTLYYANGTAVYKAALEQPKGEDGTASGDEELFDVSYMDKFARELYNGLDVNPYTGQIYVNSIKGVGNFYTTNQIWVFDASKGYQEPLYKFENYSHFPAGAFFAPQAQ